MSDHGESSSFVSWDEVKAKRAAQDATQLRVAAVTAAIYCRSQACNGNIAIMQYRDAMRTLGQHVLGVEEFGRWERWVAPGYVVLNAARNGGAPPSTL